MLIDTHAHLTYSEVCSDINGLSAGFNAQGLAAVITVGVDMASSRRCVEIAEKNECVYASVGVHPHDIKGFSDADCDELVRLSSSGKVVAIGECGLDYHYEPYDKRAQAAAFEKQLELSRMLNKPVIIHLREAFADMDEILSRHKQCRGVLHCFSGGANDALRYVEMGYYISFSGSVTYKNSLNLRAAAGAVPEDRILVETDCPYLSPVPLRGKTNRPENVYYVAEEIARVRGISFEKISEITTRNACTLFGLRL